MNRLPSLILVAVGLSGCQVSPMGLDCGVTTASFTLNFPGGGHRSGDLGCRAGVQSASAEKSENRLLLRLDSGALVEEPAVEDEVADTGSAEDAQRWDPSDGVMIGLAWSGWDRQLQHTMTVDPYEYPVPGDETALLGVAEAFNQTPELPETAIVAVFYEGRFDTQVVPSTWGGTVRASRYRVIKEAGEVAFLQLMIEDLEMEDGSLLTLEADVQLTGREIKARN